jgi:Icc-related predicted phosphoesterase
MASIFGSKYSGTPPTSGIAADKAEVLRTYKNLSSGSLGPLPENVFHPTEIRIVHMSNSYNFFSRSSSHAFLPKGDILVHSGDFSLEGTDEDFAQFDGWLKTMKHHYHYRIVVLGLRDVRRYGVDWEVMKALLPHATHVLCHEEVTVMGLRFYGCPWNWGHDVDYSVRSIAPTSTSGRFEDIPPGVHVLVTHGAAFGTLDTKGRDKSIMHLGSRDLAEHVALMRPGLHLHGHVCSARGVSPASKHSASPLVLNSCVCDEEQTVVYATAQVVRCSRLQSEDESSSWVFTLGPLEH